MRKKEHKKHQKKLQKKHLGKKTIRNITPRLNTGWDQSQESNHRVCEKKFDYNDSIVLFNYTSRFFFINR